MNNGKFWVVVAVSLLLVVLFITTDSCGELPAPPMPGDTIITQVELYNLQDDVRVLRETCRMYEKMTRRLFLENDSLQKKLQFFLR